MKKTEKKLLALGVFCMACSFAAGCGSKKEPEAAAQQVMKITIAPEPSPTLAPDEMNPDAVVTNGGITMVNPYLADNAGTAGNSTAAGTADPQAEPQTDAQPDGEGNGKGTEDEGGGENE